MTFQEFANKIQEAALVIQKSNVKLDEIQVEFEVDDRSEGTTITVDKIDKILYDLMNTEKITINLS